MNARSKNCVGRSAASSPRANRRPCRSRISNRVLRGVTSPAGTNRVAMSRGVTSRAGKTPAGTTRAMATMTSANAGNCRNANPFNARKQPRKRRLHRRRRRPIPSRLRTLIEPVSAS